MSTQLKRNSGNRDPRSYPRLQFHRFHFSDELLVVVGEERTDHVEHGITQATDVHNVSSLTSLNRLVRRQIDANQLWVGFLTCQLASWQRRLPKPSAESESRVTAASGSCGARPAVKRRTRSDSRETAIPRTRHTTESVAPFHGSRSSLYAQSLGRAPRLLGAAAIAADWTKHWLLSAKMPVSIEAISSSLQENRKRRKSRRASTGSLPIAKTVMAATQYWIVMAATQYWIL